MISRLFAATAWAVASVLPVVSGNPTDLYNIFPRQNYDLSTLRPKLSANAQIYLPGTPEFTNLTVRWSNLETPNPNIVIVPATERDVSEIVKFAWTKDIPILGYNGHHGAITTLGRMDSGIEIYLPLLNSISIAKDGKTVTVGGGTNSKKLVDALWAAGKQTVTGTCECVSYLGPALGGGHGWLQGYHGLISDQWVSMNVVLADGTLKTITPQSDLWWAMGGAGHNFGIVTSVTAKIYPLVRPNWAIETIVFSGDKVEAVYAAANKYILQGGNQSADIINWSYWLNDASLDPEKPVIVMYILQEGVNTVDPKYTKPFHDIGPLAVSPKSGTYRDLAAWTGIALDSPPCQDFGFNNPRFPIYTKSYNVTAQKKAYELYKTAVSGASNPYYNSIFMFEDYGTKGVRSIDTKATAFGFRQDLILSAPLIIYAGEGPERDAAVKQLGNQLREILREGTGSPELHAYVNYAYGNEGPKSWYGYETWRQDRLRALKQKYDPKGKFSFYGQIV
ncbi:FAD-binding domain-containing protein [Westerdykella ornata]|uniref:FAD-binding domain-containing protein n=1 Tax=Westerdykella ornata TaxID=318751 RepID=A0A6A6JK25_WESOR|nr:FAD-binding domain-containing protein [Westerdykella ornata]KAF2276857.1 FAD-binding domain-containing protein [Westerdykella ornata]